MNRRWKSRLGFGALGLAALLPPVAVAELQVAVYECAGRDDVVVSFEGEQAWLFDVQGTRQLAQQPAASGARYADAEVSLWTKGEQARLEMTDGRQQECSNNRQKAVWERAKLGGADFRAVGNEPPWVLEIREENQLLFEIGYDSQRSRFADVSRQLDAAQEMTRYSATSGTGATEQRLEVSLSAGPCADDMSGAPYETTVQITLNGRTLHGCGKSLH